MTVMLRISLARSLSLCGLVILLAVFTYLAATKNHVHRFDLTSIGRTVFRLDVLDRNNTDEKITAERFSMNEGNKECMCGHVDNFLPVCGNDGCLITLSHTSVLPYPKDRFQDKDTMHFIESIGGWCNVKTHSALTRDVSIMQWQNNVYGSVGEIGVYHGKYSAILGYVTDTEAGERFFAADIFENKTARSMELGRYSLFLQNMKRVGFSTNPDKPTRKLYLYHDSSFFLRKTLFLHLDLPAFRLLSIDGDHMRPAVLRDFETAACIMRKGGIIVFDDAYNGGKEVDKGIRDFFDYYGTGAFKPLIYSQNKMYVCTSDYYPIYMKYIRKNLQRKYGFKEVSEERHIRNGHIYMMK